MLGRVAQRAHDPGRRLANRLLADRHGFHGLGLRFGGHHFFLLHDADELHVHAAVEFAVLFRSVRDQRVGLALAIGHDGVGIHAEFDELALHGLRPAHGESLVVAFRTQVAGVADDAYAPEDLAAGDQLGDAAQAFARLGADLRAVEREEGVGLHLGVTAHDARLGLRGLPGRGRGLGGSRRGHRVGRHPGPVAAAEGIAPGQRGARVGILLLEVAGLLEVLDRKRQAVTRAGEELLRGAGNGDLVRIEITPLVV